MVFILLAISQPSARYKWEVRMVKCMCRAVAAAPQTPQVGGTLLKWGPELP